MSVAFPHLKKKMNDISVINAKALEVFPVLNKSSACPPISNETLEFVTEQCNLLGISETVYEAVMLEIQTVLHTVVVPRFWSTLEREPYLPDDFSDPGQSVDNMSEGKNTMDRSGTIGYQMALFQHFLEAIRQLNTDYLNLAEVWRRAESLKPVPQTESTLKGLLRKMLQTALYSQLSASFNGLVHGIYDVAYKVFVINNQDKLMCIDDNLGDDMDQELSHCIGCELELKLCFCQELLDSFKQSNDMLKSMELLDRFAGQPLTNLIKKHIGAHVRDYCQGVFNRSHLHDLKLWLEEIVLNWLTRVYNNGQLDVLARNVSTFAVIQDFKVKLTYFMYETYANVLIEQFFNIIIDYPDSIPVIDDLKVCLEMIDLRKHLITNLKESLRARILHAGVNTMDILTGYVAAIKAIRYLDSSDIILEAVMNPIKEYLRNRPDTVRKVVMALTEDGPTDLAEELAKGETLKENVYTAGKEDISNWENWQPDSIEAYINSAQIVKESNRSSDIISMVVNIYGSKDLFVNEYRNLLADRLLTHLDFSAEREIRNMELLKLRFGESLLHSCEVMLKDISDSKRINAHIQGDLDYSDDKQFDISTLIVSSQFWPTFNKETLELPKDIADEFKRYTKSYEAYKGNRTLNWRYVTGRVTIEVELVDRVLHMSVSPTQAVILYHFQYKNKWALEELSQLTKVPPSVLRRKIGFWQTHGIIRECSSDVYELVEGSDHRSHMHTMNVSAEMGEDEGETAMASASDQRQEELQVFWSYIVGMLTNLDSLPIDRIHQMLKLFASHGPGIEFSREELKNFLQTKVREHKLVFTGGVYQLTK